MAKKLIGIYFTLFQLILEGKVGHAHELKASQEAQETPKGGGKKLQKKKQSWKPRPGGGKGGSRGPNPSKQQQPTPQQPQQPSSQVRPRPQPLSLLKHMNRFLQAVN